MENENILIESENYQIKETKKMIIIAIVIIIVSICLGRIFNYIGNYYEVKAMNVQMNSSLKLNYEKYNNSTANIYKNVANFMEITCICGVCILIIYGGSNLLALSSKSIKLVVTDKRVYGKNFWGNQIDLPLDSISAISKNILGGVTISTSSGRISFILIYNSDDIFKVISELLINRQKSKQVDTNKTVNSNAEEIKKYKELLDIGAITEEEYDIKKKELLK